MKIRPIIYAFLPGIGNGTRFRICIRLHEILRKHNSAFLGECLKAHMQKKYGCEISKGAIISPKALFMHTVGVVIGEGAIIEDNVTIYSSVVLGKKNVSSESDYPLIKKGSILYAGCKILGGIVLEENTIVGAGSIVLNSCIPGGGIYVGTPARRIEARNGD